MLHDPIKQRFFKSNIGAGLFALDPLVFQNLFALGEELLVEHRVFHELRVFVFGGCDSVIFHQKISTNRCADYLGKTRREWQEVKPQIPNPNTQGSTNHQTPKETWSADLFEDWSLGFSGV